jgi:quercetin dioxygenase-like cupin family protein
VEVVDLLALEGRGPLWGVATDDLNATLLAWGAGERVTEHVNETRDVLVVVVAGGGTLTVDGDAIALRTGLATVIPKGARRMVEAGPAGLSYLTAHRVRGGLEIRPVSPA